MTAAQRTRAIVVGVFVVLVIAGVVAENQWRSSEYDKWTMFAPPEWTRAAWDSLQKCAGVQSRITYDHLDWREGPRMIPAVFSGGRRASHGAFDRKTNTIYLMSKFKDDEQFLRHEMMHAILTPMGNHPQFAFNRKCGTIID